ncbi:DUF2975 domain-containing protein [Mesonia sp. K7]|nr:DUF2975 domain-containing protein [Mesonia sp. K7]
MRRGSTLFLKATIVLIAIAAIGVCGLLSYLIITSDDVGAYKPILLAIILSVIPFFMGLYQAFKLLEYVDKNIAFSELSIKALKKIKIYALVLSVFYLLCMPYIYYVAEKDDAPGGILIGLVLIAAPTVVTVFAATLEELLKNAIEIKSENDLTV